MNKFLPLAIYLVIVGILWLAFDQHESTRTEDRILLIFIAIVYLSCTVIILGYTERWRLLSIGSLGTSGGTFLLYMLLARPPEGWSIRVPQPLIRALFLSGGIAMLIGMVMWAHEKRHRDDSCPCADE